MKPGLFRLKAVLFDFDGTLTQPGALDFLTIKRAIGCPITTPVLEFIETLATSQEKDAARKKLEEFEEKAAAASVPNESAEDAVRAVKAAGLKVGILTRNTRKSISQSLENFKTIRVSDFDIIMTREEPVAPKPNPDAVILGARRLGIDVSEILVVGDYIFDVLAGNRAGAWTALLKNGDTPAHEDIQSDFTISRLWELAGIVRLGLPLRTGKLPNDMLGEFLNLIPKDDASVLLFPGVGEDVAIVDGSGSDLLVLKSDPITFVSESVGRYTVAVNANDIATSGATPRWLLTTLLFPDKSVPWEIREVIKELADVANRNGIALVGGHTEITDAVRRPIVSAMVVGTVSREKFIDKKKMAPGDMILFTKAVAVEGTAIIAREFHKRLAGMGMTESELERCRKRLDEISILEEAAMARDFSGVHAMHDVTEGGLATAVAELSTAAGRRIRINMDAIPVYAETLKICRLLKLNPMGLIGSGSLLIACSPTDHPRLVKTIQEAGIEVVCIGEALGAGKGVESTSGGAPTPWPHFDRDELTRLFE